MIIDFTIEDLLLDSYLQKNFHTPASGKTTPIANTTPSYHGVSFVEAEAPAAFVTYIRAILLRDKLFPTSTHSCFCREWNPLSLRLERHAENTKKMMDYLGNHP